MSIYFNFESSTDLVGHLLTFIALLLAYIGYAWSVDRDLKSTEALFLSLKEDLDYFQYWLGKDGYTKSKYKDKNSFCPVKVIFPLSLEVLSEITRRGSVSLPGIPRGFNGHLALFNERIMAFNSALEHIKTASSANPVMTERLHEKLVALGLRKTEDELSYEAFKKSIEDLKADKLTEDLYYLATNIRRLNYNVHVDLIANKEKTDKLNYLYIEIKKELGIILTNFDKNKPFIIWGRPLIIVGSIVTFFVVEYFLS